MISKIYRFTSNLFHGFFVGQNEFISMDLHFLFPKFLLGKARNHDLHLVSKKVSKRAVDRNRLPVAKLRIFRREFSRAKLWTKYHFRLQRTGQIYKRERERLISACQQLIKKLQ